MKPRIVRRYGKHPPASITQTGTPAAIVERLNQEINAGLADPKIKEPLTNLGDVPMPMTPAEFGKFIDDETAKWAKVIKFAGITME